jgi:sugar/nucleoside kinase (ribokinase family)
MPEPIRRIISFGDVIDDVVAIPVGPIRDDTDTPSSIRFIPGGSAANTAAWLGELGAAVEFYGSVGQVDLDRHGRLLADGGVRAHLFGHEGVPTGTIVVIVEGENRTMLTERGANALLDPAWITDDVLAQTALLHITGHTLLNEAGADAVTELIARAKWADTAVSVDPGSAGFIADYGVTRFLEAFAGADILFPSLEEGRLLAGRETPELVAASLGEWFPTIVLTLGTAGVALSHEGLGMHVDAVETDVIDPTGAGDAFCAGFLNEWVQSANLKSSAEAGVTVASRAVGLIGGRPPR